MEKKDRSGAVRYILIAVAVLLCILIFVFFGKRASETLSPENEPTPLPSQTPVPKGITVEAFIGAIEASGIDCTVSKAQKQENGSLLYALEMPNENDSGSITLFTDAIGRIESCELRIGYLFASGDSTVGKEVLETIKKEYERRERYDKALIETYLDAVLDLSSQDCGIGSAERSKLVSAVISAYSEQKDHSKKYGAARIGCTMSAAGYNAEFLLEIRFDLSKMK